MPGFYSKTVTIPSAITSPILWMIKPGPERLSHLPKVTQLDGDWAGL